MKQGLKLVTAVPLAAARQQLLPLVRQAAHGACYAITQHGRPEAVLVSADRFFAPYAALHGVAAVVLAATGGRRGGVPDPAVTARLCRRLLQAGLAPVVVVADAGDRRLTAALAATRVAVTFCGSGNPGFSSSLKRGVRFIAPWGEALLVAFASLPDVRVATLRKMLAAWHRERRGIVQPEYRGRRGHPVLLAAGYQRELLALDPRRGMQTFMRRHQADIRTVAVTDAGILKRKDR